MHLIRPFFAVALTAAALAWSGAAAQSAAPDPALAAIPLKIADALVANDAATLRAACAANATVVDEFAPYSWSGGDACARWAAGFKAFAAQAKLTGFKAAVDPKPFTDVTGNRAYLTAQVTFKALAAGHPIAERGSWTFVFLKSGDAWKITSLAWGTLHH